MPAKPEVKSMGRGLALEIIKALQSGAQLGLGLTHLAVLVSDSAMKASKPKTGSIKTGKTNLTIALALSSQFVNTDDGTVDRLTQEFTAAREQGDPTEIAIAEQRLLRSVDEDGESAFLKDTTDMLLPASADECYLVIFIWTGAKAFPASVAFAKYVRMRYPSAYIVMASDRHGEASKEHFLIRPRELGIINASFLVPTRGAGVLLDGLIEGAIGAWPASQACDA